MSEKSYFIFDDGYDTKEERGPFWDTVLGEEDADDDTEVLPLLSNAK
jgi:hypothetical protein